MVGNLSQYLRIIHNMSWNYKEVEYGTIGNKTNAEPCPKWTVAWYNNKGDYVTCTEYLWYRKTYIVRYDKYIKFDHISFKYTFISHTKIYEWIATLVAIFSNCQDIKGPLGNLAFEIGIQLKIRKMVSYKHLAVFKLSVQKERKNEKGTVLTEKKTRIKNIFL